MIQIDSWDLLKKLIKSQFFSKKFGISSPTDFAGTEIYGLHQGVYENLLSAHVKHSRYGSSLSVKSVQISCKIQYLTYQILDLL